MTLASAQRGVGGFRKIKHCNQLTAVLRYIIFIYSGILKQLHYQFSLVGFELLPVHPCLKSISAMRILLVLLLLCSPAPAQVLRLAVKGTQSTGTDFTGWGTCFSVGVTEENKSVLLTARHNLDDAKQYRVYCNKKWYTPSNVQQSEIYDVASMEIDCVVPCYNLTAPKVGSSVTIFGYGPEYHGRKAVGFTGKIIDDQNVRGSNGLHSISGDSGGPAVVGKDCFGMVVSHEAPTAYRSDYASMQLTTQIVSSQRIESHLCQYYSRGICGPSGCTVWTPRNVRPVRPQPSVPAATVSSQAIQNAVNSWLTANADKLRGKDGKNGVDGADGTTTIQPLKVILTRDGKIVDQEVIQPGQPLILDVRSLTNE